MKLILVDPSFDVCRAWEAAFSGVKVDIENMRFEELDRSYDCMVSAANSYGRLDGGVDLAIRQYFPLIQENLDEAIVAKWHGYQPVGTSMLVPTLDEDHPWVAHTPTMAIPGRIPRDSSVIHDAMWAMLNTVAAEPSISIVACPGLGTLTGRVPAEAAAHQMAVAYKMFLNPAYAHNWHSARFHMREIKGG